MAWVGPLLGSRPDVAISPALESVDKQSLPELLSRWRPQLSLDVPNYLGRGPRYLTLELTFDDIRSFTPEAIVQSVAGLRGLAAVRRTLAQLMDEPLELQSFSRHLVEAGAEPQWAAEFQRALLETRGTGSPEAPSPQAPRAVDPESRLSGLLDMVELPGERPKTSPAEEAFRRMVRTLAGASGRQRGQEKSLASDVIAQLDQVLSPQLDAILHHPDFLALESAWRGLKFLVDRTDFHKGVVLEVLAASKQDLADRLHEHVFRPEREAPRSPTLAAVWLDYEFDATARDMEVLGNVAKMAESIQVPFIAAVGPEFFGASSSAEVAGFSPLWQHLERPEFISYRSLRDRPSSQYLALTFPRMLTRMPYGPKGKPVADLGWNEDDVRPERDLPWGRAVAALASRMAGSHAASGWPVAIQGPASGGEVTDLALVEVPLPDGRRAHLSLDAVLGESTLDELAEAGFVVLATSPNSDQAYVAAAPCVHRVAPQQDSAALRAARREASLPYRALAAVVTGCLAQLAARITAGATATTVRKHFEDGLRAQMELRGEKDRLAVHVEPDPDAPNRLAVGIHLRLPVVLMGAEAEMDLALSIGI